MQLFAPHGSHAPDPVQRFSMVLMSVLVLLTFVGANLQALLWQSSDWLVSTVLPAVVVDLTNDKRAENARRELVRNPVLDRAATAKAQHMAENEYFAHYAPDGTTPWQFFSAEGYVFANAGENLAIHFTDSSEVVDAWMRSPSHKKNIVDSKFREIGVGTAKGKFDGYDTVYVVQLFGTPAMSQTDTIGAQTSTVPPLPTTPPATAAMDDSVATSASTTVAELAALKEQIEAVSAAVTNLTDKALEANFTTTFNTDSVAPPADTLTQPSALTEQNREVQTPVEPPATVLVSGSDTVVVSSELSTSSGLAVATLIEPSRAHAGATIAAVATQPNVLLDIVYTGVVGVIVVLLVASLLGEARRLHVVQVAYSIALLFVIGGLWYIHALLTSGAVIV